MVLKQGRRGALAAVTPAIPWAECARGHTARQVKVVARFVLMSLSVWACVFNVFCFVCIGTLCFAAYLAWFRKKKWDLWRPEYRFFPLSREDLRRLASLLRPALLLAERDNKTSAT